MPLTKENFEQFYVGNAAEHKIMSDLFFLSLESHKLNPDIGLDLLVTNKAICQYHNAEKIHHYLQVKSTFLIDNIAKFYISQNELNYLMKNDDVTTVFCYIEPLIQETAKSFDRGDFEPWRESLEAEGEYHLYHQFNTLKKDGCLSQIDFKGFEMKYIWLNNAQLNRAFNDNLFKPLPKKENYDELCYLELNIDNDDCLVMINNENNASETEGTIIEEITNLYYLFNYSKTRDRLESGDFLHEHY